MEIQVLDRDQFLSVKKGSWSSLSKRDRSFLEFRDREGVWEEHALTTLDVGFEVFHLGSTIFSNEIKSDKWKNN